MRESLAAIAHLERAVVTAPGLEGVALRYGGLYGPGTSLAEESGAAGPRAASSRLSAAGPGVWSFVHVADAAAAAVAALERGAPGVYNVVDDDPAPVSEWLPYLAGAARGEAAPARARVARAPGGRRARARPHDRDARARRTPRRRRELGWAPRYPSWRDGLPRRARPDRPHRPPAVAGMSGEDYTELRPLLFSIAYRMTGSVADSEDIVQEALLRHHRAPETPRSSRTAPTSPRHHGPARHRPPALGARAPRGVCRAVAARADRRRRARPDPAEHAETADSLSLAFLVVLESLTPVERAVFLLREVFDYDYDEIARIVGKSEANCRQLAVRARAHVEDRKPQLRGLARAP